MLLIEEFVQGHWGSEVTQGAPAEWQGVLPTEHTGSFSTVLGALTELWIAGQWGTD